MEKLFRYTFQNAEGKKHYEIFELSEVVGDKDLDFIQQYKEDGYELVKWDEQYIGIEDIKGDLIFEGDKVRFTNPKFNEVQEGFIDFENCSYCIKKGRVTLYKLTDFPDMEIIN
jgi:hypothetical protein